MLFAIPKGGSSNEFVHPINGNSFPIPDADYRKQLVAIEPDGGYSVMKAPRKMGGGARTNQLNYSQYVEMTDGLSREDAAQQYSRFLLEQMMPKS